jgi:hypothetical protein
MKKLNIARSDYPWKIIGAILWCYLLFITSLKVIGKIGTGAGGPHQRKGADQQACPGDCFRYFYTIFITD